MKRKLVYCILFITNIFIYIVGQSGKFDSYILSAALGSAFGIFVLSYLIYLGAKKLAKKENIIIFIFIWAFISYAGFMGSHSGSKNQGSKAAAFQSLSKVQTAIPYKKKLHQDKQNHYSIQFPEGWKVEKGRNPNVVAVAKNKSGESINILIRDLQDQISFENFTKSELGQYFEAMKKQLKNTGLINNINYGTTNINDKKAIWLSYDKKYKPFFQVKAH